MFIECRHQKNTCSSKKKYCRKNAIYPITRALCKKFTFPSGISSSSTPNIVSGPLSRQLVIGMVSSHALNGSYTLNPYNFKHFGCNFLAIRQNGVQIPSRAFTPDFQKKLVSREVRSLYDNIGISTHADDDGCAISVEDYLGGNSLFVFDLSKDFSNGMNLFEQDSGVIDLEVQFSSPLNESISIICYMAFDSLISITKERNVEILP